MAVCKPIANREQAWWGAKYILFILCTIGTIFIPTDPLFDPIMLNVFRVGSSFFVIGQTIIILDAAYNLNDSWVEKANKTDMEEGGCAGNKWLFWLFVPFSLLVQLQVLDSSSHNFRDVRIIWHLSLLLWSWELYVRAFN